MVTSDVYQPSVPSGSVVAAAVISGAVLSTLSIVTDAVLVVPATLAQVAVRV